jgi:hypothetical protein
LCVATGCAKSSTRSRPSGSSCPTTTNTRTNPENTLANDETSPDEAHLVDDVLQLHYGHADEAVLTGEAVVLHADVQLEVVQLFLVSDGAKKVDLVLKMNMIPKKNEMSGVPQG